MRGSITLTIARHSIFFVTLATLSHGMAELNAVPVLKVVRLKYAFAVLHLTAAVHNLIAASSTVLVKKKVTQNCCH